MTEAQGQHRFMTVLCFGLVYLLWGSTYLGIDIAVQDIPPASMCAIRFLLAGALMLGICLVRGQSIRYSAKDLRHLAIVGILLLMGGNLTLSYAERYVPTGLAALLVAIVPLWFLVLDTLLIGHHRIAGRGLAGLGLGIVGTAVLLWPKLTATGAISRQELWYCLSLFGGSFSWALGSVLSKRWQAKASFSAAAWQVTFAGLANLCLALVIRDYTHLHWTARGVGAVLYLVVCGSLIGYTAYIWLLAHVPTSKVSTYAYVNPVIAVFLGWLVLHESIDRYILSGSAIVVASVVLVTSAQVRNRRLSDEMPAVEAVGD